MALAANSKLSLFPGFSPLCYKNLEPTQTITTSRPLFQNKVISTDSWGYGVDRSFENLPFNYYPSKTRPPSDLNNRRELAQPVALLFLSLVLPTVSAQRCGRAEITVLPRNVFTIHPPQSPLASAPSPLSPTHCSSQKNGFPNTPQFTSRSYFSL